MLAIEKALKKQSDVPGHAFYSRYEVLRERVLSVEYAMTMAGFPGGNDHGPEHIRRVLSNLNDLLKPLPLRHLSQYELFLSMMAVLYHDIGILRGRDGHAAMSAELLSKDKEPLIFDEIDREFISSIVLSHSSSVDITACPEDQSLKGYNVRPRQLAALVRLADELDEDIRRGDPALREKLDLPQASEFYWDFNSRIRGVNIDHTRREIVFNVSFLPADATSAGLSEGDSFVNLFFRKIVKINNERVYCNRFLQPSLKMLQIRVTLQPIQGTELTKVSELVLTDNATFESVYAQIPKVLRGSISSRGSLHLPKPRKQNQPRTRVPAVLETEAIVNGYKLFFFRTGKQLSIQQLSKRAGVDTRLINNLEQVKKKVAAPHCFKAAPRIVVSALERALGCIGCLEYGQKDDLLATYLMYYNVNYQTRYRSANRHFDFAPDTKAVVFDFGGTLSRSTDPHSTWERMWLSVGYTVNDAGQLLRLFASRRISHQEWCDRTCERLRERGFSKQHLMSIMSGIAPVDGLQTTMEALHGSKVSLYVVSGSVKEIIVNVLGRAFTLLTEVKANEISFDENGIINEIRGHPFDFEGKATFLKRVIDELRCDPLEVLFVGNSLNDTWASQSGARTLCVNPSNVDFTNTAVWNDCIQDMRDLNEILPFAKRLPR